jgi:hypothetical protein
MDNAAFEQHQRTAAQMRARVEPPPSNQDGAKLLDDIEHHLGRFVAYPSPGARIAHALWVAHTHLMDCWNSTPRIAFLSPEPGSGKSRALEACELLVPNPINAVNVSVAYLFRKVGDEEGRPTILYDEVDTVFTKKGDNEDIRGLLNAGHRKHSVVGRCVVRGNRIETEETPAYCAVALAGLGDLPDTILTRSVIVRMRKRAPKERVEPYRRRDVEPEADRLRGRIETWAAGIASTVRDARPRFPEGIEDRAADVWEALLAVADAAGGAWPQRARKAAVALVAEAQDRTPSLGVRLLADLREVFGSRERMATDEIILALLKIEEAPWPDLRGKTLDPKGLARMLRPYGVTSKDLRMATRVVKGYEAADLADPWARYLSPSRPDGATSATPATKADEAAAVAAVADSGDGGESLSEFEEF